MKEYDKYVNELKAYAPEPNFDRMTARLQESITRESLYPAAHWLRPLVVGALTASFLVIFASAYYVMALRNSDYFSEYVFGGNGADSGWNFLQQ
jgi:hypothetical protein